MSHKPNIFGLNCELPRGPASTDLNQLHVQEINCHTTGYRTGGFQMWPCQQPHQTWHALLPQPVSFVPAIPGRIFLLISSSHSGQDHPGPLSPGNWESRRCWPKTTPAEPHTAEMSRTEEGFNQPSNPQARAQSDMMSVSTLSHSEELGAV